jgi:hypothetical protein
MKAWVTGALKCGLLDVLKHTSSNVSEILDFVVRLISSCASEFNDPTSNLTLAIEDTLRTEFANATSQAEIEQLVARNRLLHEAAGASVWLQLADIAFYTSDQLANALVGPLVISALVRGTPQALGGWTPTCSDTTSDSHGLYLNVALQDQFADTSKGLVDFAGWVSALGQSVAPLKGCPPQYLATLSAQIRSDWGDPRAAESAARAVLALASGVKPDVSSFTDRIIRRSSDGAAWYVDGNAVAHPIPNGGTYLCLTAWNGKEVIDNVSDDQINALPMGGAQSCTVTQAADRIIRRSGDGAAWYVDGNAVAHPIPNGGTYNCLTYLYGKQVINNVSDGQINALPMAGNDVCTALLVGPDNTAFYVDADGLRHWVPNGGIFVCLQNRGAGVFRYGDWNTINVFTEDKQNWAHCP